MSDDLLLPDSFQGQARLFPLPGFVLFPGVVHPLHIFETRYRQMIADALDGDRLIAMALLRPGWEADYHGMPAIHPVVCLGKILSEQRLEDGRFNILLQGMCRARVLEEEDSDRLYRVASVDVLTEVEPISLLKERRLRKQLAKQIPRWFASHPQLIEQLRELAGSDLPLGPLCDILSFALPLDAEVKQRQLQELDVVRRGRRLLARMKEQASSPPPPEQPARTFPPDFSSN